jgi:hypothetical protein
MSLSALIESVGDTHDTEYISTIIDNLGSPDYIIDYTSDAAYTPDDEYEGLHARRYEMIYDYGSYIISLPISETVTCVVDNNIVYDSYYENSVGYNYYPRNAFLLHLDRDFTDYNEGELIVTGIEGEISFSDFVQSEKDLVVDEDSVSQTQDSSDNANSRTDEDTDTQESNDSFTTGDKIMSIDDEFTISKWGYVLVGTVECESLHTGDEVVAELSDGTLVASKVTVMEIKRKEIDAVSKGEEVGIVLDGIDSNTANLGHGDVIYFLEKK